MKTADIKLFMRKKWIILFLSILVAFYRKKFYKELSEFGIEKLGFRRLTEFKLPDNSKAVVYQKDIKESF